jgi:hypothetical protein
VADQTEADFDVTVLPVLTSYRTQAPVAFPAPPSPSRLPRRRVARGPVAVAMVAATDTVLLVGVRTALVGADTALLIGAPTRTGSPGAPSVPSSMWPSGPNSVPPTIGPSTGPSGAVHDLSFDQPPPPPTPPAVFADIDWRNATVILPPSASDVGCPTGAVQVTDDDFANPTSVQVTLPYGALSRIRYGDLTGDGQPEAALVASCGDGDRDRVFLVVSRSGAELRVLDVFRASNFSDITQEPREIAIADGALKVAGWPDSYDRIVAPVRTTYRWDGARMVVTGAPPVARLLDTVELPALIDADGSTVCPGGEAHFAGDGMNSPTATVGGTTYRADVGKAATHYRLADAYSMDLDGDDIFELIVSMSCVAADGTERTSLYAVRQQADRFVVVDLPFADSRGPGSLPLYDYYLPPGEGALVLRLGPSATEVTVHWDGSGFVGRVGEYRW